MRVSKRLSGSVAHPPGSSDFTWLLYSSQAPITWPRWLSEEQVLTHHTTTKPMIRWPLISYQLYLHKLELFFFFFLNWMNEYQFISQRTCGSSKISRGSNIRRLTWWSEGNVSLKVTNFCFCSCKLGWSLRRAHACKKQVWLLAIRWTCPRPTFNLKVPMINIQYNLWKSSTVAQ